MSEGNEENQLYTGDTQADAEQDAGPNLLEPISWQSVEYLHHEKNTKWYLGFSGISVTLVLIAVLLMNSWSFAVLIIVMAISVIIYSLRPPRTLKYTASQQGIYIGEALRPFSEFKAFGVIKDENEFSIKLVPIKRFSPALTVYFPEEMGEKIVDMLGVRVPMQDLELDPIDKLVRKLRL